MKRFISLIISVLMLCSLVPVSAFAEEVTEYTYEKFKYTINDGEITITQYTSTSTGVHSPVIPTEIDGIPVTTIGAEAFRGKIRLRKISIPDSIIRIEERAFCGTGLETVEIGKNVEYIGKEAFLGCDSLKEVEIPDSVTHLGKGVFNGCSGLEAVYFGKGITAIPEECFYRCESLIGYISESSITSIGANAFKECESLLYVYLDDGLETIESGTFNYCKSLMYVEIPNSVKRIGGSAFHYCESLSYVNLPDGLTYIGSFAFASSRIESIVIPATVTEVGDYAFRDCLYLKQYLFKGTLTGTLDLFYNSGIEYAIIPDGIEDLGRSAFDECEHLEKVYIPNSIKSISTDQFHQGCRALKDIYFAGTEEEWNAKLRKGNSNFPFTDRVTVHFNAVPADVSDDYVAEVDGVEYIVPAKKAIYLDMYEALMIDNLCFVFVQWEIDYGNITFEDVNSTFQTIVMPAEDFCVRSVFRLVADLNSDEKVNARDKAALTSLIKSDSFDEYADVNLDGKVNARDKAAVAEIIKGNYDYAPYFEAE